MFRIDDATATPSLPTPETAGSEGYFTEGNPTAGTPATNVRGSWLNMIQEELCAILAAAGIARSKTSYSQVNSALQKMYAPVVGSVRNLAMNVSSVSASATLTADQIIVASALNGQTYQLPSFNKTINLANTGAGGMDTGTSPTSGYVALYAIYNPTTATSALLAVNATSAAAPNVYGGANMPSGYTVSALVSVRATDPTGKLQPGMQRDRKVSFPLATLLSTATTAASATAMNVAAVIPPNAVSVGGEMGASSTIVSAVVSLLAGDAAMSGQQAIYGGATASAQYICNFDVDIAVPQTLYRVATNSSGTPTFSYYASSYRF
ncbi:hypothetical protein [Caballeronia sp. LZ035]|uniref:hypothetical protein n=1 Tax=Caballeronia sp. LZ035 TaxID=3038568 RepID=UPI00285484CE|nr:hypothetical protein [Caballeronia sp. LZ035]MDR5757034.1 hypothetical protein [Caballeronia sp. LZ035]